MSNPEPNEVAVQNQRVLSEALAAVDRDMATHVRTERPRIMNGGPKALVAERGKTHGEFNDHARITQMLKLVMHKTDKWESLTPAQKESLEMIVHKIGRILAGSPDFRDHWDDIAGYAVLVAERVPQ